jgi:FkbM family methyltransferase
MNSVLNYIPLPRRLRRRIRLYSEMKEVLSNPWEIASIDTRENSAECRAQFTDGKTLVVRNNHGDVYVLVEVFVHKAYEQLIQRFGRVGVVVDIGANIGAFTLAVSSTAGRVVAVEPDPGTFSILTKNIEANQLSNSVDAINVAVGGVSRRAAFLSDRNNSVLCALESAVAACDSKTATRVEVEVLTLGALFDRCDVQHCDLLKIDCEGSEYELLVKSNREAFERVRAVIMEVHKQSETGEEIRGIVNWLEESGMAVECMPTLPEMLNGIGRIGRGHGVGLVVATRP